MKLLSFWKSTKFNAHENILILIGKSTKFNAHENILILIGSNLCWYSVRLAQQIMHPP